jgi:hypothetical protein
MTTDNDAKYRAALAAYHASLRENFLSFLWSRPAHESFTAERNGFAELEQTSGNVFDLKPPRSEKRNGRVFDSMDVLASPTISTVSRPAASSITSFASINAITIPTSPIIEKSVNVINPLTGRRLGSDPRLPTPPGREQIRQQARERAQLRHHRQFRTLPESPPIVEQHPNVVVGTQSLSAPPMERSLLLHDKHNIPRHTRTNLRSCPEINIFSDRLVPSQKPIPTRKALSSCPTRPTVFHRTTSSSSFRERRRPAAKQPYGRSLASPSPSSASLDCTLSRLHINPPKKNTRQTSYQGTQPHHYDHRTPRYTRGRRSLAVDGSAAESSGEEEMQSETESEPSSASGRSSHSSLAVTSPVVRRGPPSPRVTQGMSSSISKGPTILIRRHADELHHHHLHAISPRHPHHLSPPMYEIMTKHHRLPPPIDRRNSGTTLTDLTPRTEFSEASFAALAPSPLFATTEIHRASSPSSPLDGSPGFEGVDAGKEYDQYQAAACPPPKQHSPVNQPGCQTRPYN